MSAMYSKEDWVFYKYKNSQEELAFIEVLFDDLVDQDSKAIEESLEGKALYRRFVLLKTILFPMEWTLTLFLFGFKDAAKSYKMFRALRQSLKEGSDHELQLRRTEP